MIRLICTEANAGMAANVGGPVMVSSKTFDVSAPEVEAWLSDKSKLDGYTNRMITGFEVLEESRDDHTK